MGQSDPQRAEAQPATSAGPTITTDAAAHKMLWDSVPSVWNIIKCALSTRLLLLVLARLGSLLPHDFDSSSELISQLRCLILSPEFW